MYKEPNWTRKQGAWEVEEVSISVIHFSDSSTNLRVLQQGSEAEVQPARERVIVLQQIMALQNRVEEGLAVILLIGPIQRIRCRAVHPLIIVIHLYVLLLHRLS